jgi:hypothetical protein
MWGTGEWRAFRPAATRSYRQKKMTADNQTSALTSRACRVSVLRSFEIRAGKMSSIFNSSRVAEHPLIRRLSALSMDCNNFVIFGSGPLLVHGLRSRISDLDIVARGTAWERAKMLGEPTKGPINGEDMIHFWGGLIEVSSGWVPGEWDVDELIDSADIVEGFRFAKLSDVLLYKKSLRRGKDIPDIAAIEAYTCSGLSGIAS